MTLEMLIIAAVRIVGSFPVLRWPFYGAIIAMLVDQSDLLLLNLLDLGGVHDYQTFDKYLDQVYLALFMVVAWRWHGVERNVAAGLYVFRLIGFFAFELTESRTALLLFPNFFEFWFVFIAARREFGWAEKVPFTLKVDGRWNRALLLPVGVVVALKLFQEYVVHHGKWLDGFTTVEALEAIWDFLRPF